MEGPTPSSAIFYGSLSVHFGLFLLLRTEPFWQNQVSIRWFVAFIGLATSVTAYLIAKVQTNIKAQIAYASISQIGLMFIEVAAGWNGLVLLHFAANAFLRTYQLLVSPSLVAYKIRDQFYFGSRRARWLLEGRALGWQRKFYAMALTEFRMDQRLNRWVFRPIKQLGRKLPIQNTKQALVLLLLVWSAMLLIRAMGIVVTESAHHAWATVLAGFGLLLVFRAFSERQSPLLTWLLVAGNHLTMAFAISFNEQFSGQEFSWYLSGVALMGIFGQRLIRKMSLEIPNISMHEYYGYATSHPRVSLFFFLACLGLMGFPISPTFVGEDLLFSHIHEQQVLLAVFFHSGTSSPVLLCYGFMPVFFWVAKRARIFLTH